MSELTHLLLLQAQRRERRLLAAIAQLASALDLLAVDQSQRAREAAQGVRDTIAELRAELDK